MRSAIQEASPSIVRIQTIGNAGSDELEVSSQVTTGIVISDHGEILTSLFGFSGQPAAIFVEDSTGQRVAATVVATDYLRKLVLLKCAEGRFRKAAFSESQWPAVGAYAVAAGRMYPAKLPSASLGIISAVNRIHGLAIQTDAKISPVNFGGPLLELNGRAMGILVPLSPRDSSEEIGGGVEWYDSGIGFAIPATDALRSAEKLRSGTDLFPGVLGVKLSTKNPLAEQFELTEVYPDSPAASAGLKQHDTVIEVNGTKIDRFGVFESVIKGAYAGDRLALKIKRGDDEFDAELQLAEKLKRPPKAFLGIISQKVVKSGDNAIGVKVAVLPLSPLSVAGMPESAIITEWNSEPLTSLDELSKHLRSIIVGNEIQLTYKESESGDNNTMTVVPGTRSSIVVPLSETFVDEAIGITHIGSTDWQRQQDVLKDDAGKVWYYAASATEDQACGIAVLLSESQTPQELLLRKWEALCRLHNLILVVVQNKEDTELSREDSPLVPLAIAAVAKGRKIDPDRVFLVTEKRQTEVAVELLLNPRLRQLRSAVFLETWPRISGIPEEAIAQKTPALLLLTGQIQSRQDQALLAQTVNKLTESGSSVAQHKIDTDSNIEETIASWAVSLKAR